MSAGQCCALTVFFSVGTWQVWRSQQDVVRLLTWLLQKDVIVPVFEHYYLCIPSPTAAATGGFPCVCVCVCARARACVCSVR